jgi:hypothetical protein
MHRGTRRAGSPRVTRLGAAGSPNRGQDQLDWNRPTPRRVVPPWSPGHICAVPRLRHRRRELPRASTTLGKPHVRPPYATPDDRLDDRGRTARSAIFTRTRRRRPTLPSACCAARKNPAWLQTDLQAPLQVKSATSAGALGNLGPALLGKMRPGRLHDCAHNSTGLALPELVTVSRHWITVNPGVPGFDPSIVTLIHSIRSGSRNRTSMPIIRSPIGRFARKTAKSDR